MGRRHFLSQVVQEKANGSLVWLMQGGRSSLPCPQGEIASGSPWMGGPIQGHCKGCQLPQATVCVWPLRFLCPWSFPGKNTTVGCHVLLQDIFPTQGLNPCFQPLGWSPVSESTQPEAFSREIALPLSSRFNEHQSDRNTLGTSPQTRKGWSKLLDSIM